MDTYACGCKFTGQERCSTHGCSPIIPVDTTLAIAIETIEKLETRINALASLVGILIGNLKYHQNVSKEVWEKLRIARGDDE